MVRVTDRINAKPFPLDEELGPAYNIRALDPAIAQRYAQPLEYIVGFDIAGRDPLIEAREWNAVMLNPPELPA